MIRPVVGRLCEPEEEDVDLFGVDVNGPREKSGPDEDEFGDFLGVDMDGTNVRGPEEVLTVTTLVTGSTVVFDDDGEAISNILPKSPEFFMLPPVYGVGVDVIAGLGFDLPSGRPDTISPPLNRWLVLPLAAISSLSAASSEDGDGVEEERVQ